jgi:hypothetical protein
MLFKIQKERIARSKRLLEKIGDRPLFNSN